MSALEKAIHKNKTHIIYLLFLCFVIAYIDRTNISFAQLQMNSDLSLSSSVYGLGAGIFFVGYVLFEIPSNLIMMKVGAKTWIARIMITWGIVSALMLFVETPTQFYIVRFLLGVAEAGFFPGVMLYLTHWFPSDKRAFPNALFLTAMPVSAMIRGVISGIILDVFKNSTVMAAWQWLFLIEAIPAVILGIVVFFYLPNTVNDASWLSNKEKKMLNKRLMEDSQKTIVTRYIIALLKTSKLWLMAACVSCFASGMYGIMFWLPEVIKETGVKDPMHIGLLSVIPWAVSTVSMLLVGRSAEKYGHHFIHLAVSALIGALGLVIGVAYSDNTALALIALSIATAGVMSTFPVFWGTVSFLGGIAAAAGFALINSIGSIAGFVAPSIMGVIVDSTKSTNIGLYAMAMLLVLGACLALFIRHVDSVVTRKSSDSNVVFG